MKKIIVLLLSSFIASSTVADDHAKFKAEKGYEPGRHFLLDDQDCKDTKDGVGQSGFLLRACGELFNGLSSLVQTPTA